MAFRWSRRFGTRDVRQLEYSVVVPPARQQALILEHEPPRKKLHF